MATKEEQDRLVDRPRSGENRNEYVLRVLRDAGQVTVGDLAASLEVSEMTVRRILSRLDREGALKRVHGGATLRRGSFSSRTQVRHEEKERIARAAARLVEPDESVGIDIGTTCHAVASELAARDDLLVVTNSIYAALEFQHSRSAAVVLGGQITAEASLVSVDPASARGGIHLDKFILGCGGVSAEHGVSYFDIGETHVRQELCDHSNTVILVADESKLQRRRAVFLEGGIEAIDVLVTSAQPPRELAVALAAAGVELVIAEDD